MAAHTGNKIGGARDQLKVVLDAAEPLFFKLSERNKKKQAPLDTEHAHNVHGNECG